MYNKIKILLIEDNLDIIEIVKAKARKIPDIELVVGSNTLDFLDNVNRKNFDIILCDINLDFEGEGLVIVELFQRMDINAEIIAFTGSMHLTKEYLLNAGFSDVYYKNFKVIDHLFEKHIPELLNIYV